MLISIVTATYNSAKTVRDTFESVLRQSFTNYEYIVVDGGSQDETIDIIREYESIFGTKMKWFSDTDEGMYDAILEDVVMHLYCKPITAFSTLNVAIHVSMDAMLHKTMYDEEKYDYLYNNLRAELIKHLFELKMENVKIYTPDLIRLVAKQMIRRPENVKSLVAELL